MGNLTFVYLGRRVNQYGRGFVALLRHTYPQGDERDRQGSREMHVLCRLWKTLFDADVTSCSLSTRNEKLCGKEEESWDWD